MKRHIKLIVLTSAFWYLSHDFPNNKIQNKKTIDPIPAKEKPSLEFITLKSALPVPKSNSLEYLPYREITEITNYLPSNKDNPEPFYRLSDR